MNLPQSRPPRIQIEVVWPEIDCGRYPVKRSVGDAVEVWATIFRDGHETLGAAVLYRAPGSTTWQEPARWGGWCELFPRSGGGCAGVERVPPRLAGLGFDALSLPPIHPIGHTNRKGKNNALKAGPRDPGSPWAIGSENGGHTAIEP